MKATPTVVKSLAILYRYAGDQGIAPREFGHFLWTDWPAWRHHSKAGNHGSTTGGGMNLAAGAWLGKLNQAGWARRWGSRGWDLTTEGHRVLAENVLITTYPPMRNNTERDAFIEGFKAAAHRKGKLINPYNSHENNATTLTWLFALYRYWERGWTHFQDRIEALSTPKEVPEDV